MKNQNLINVIYAYIKAHKGTSFVDIERIFENFDFNYKGNRTVLIPGYNVALWFGWNDEAIEIINKAMDMGTGMVEAHKLIYMIDGKFPALPIAKRLKNYSKPHWYPVVFI